MIRILLAAALFCAAASGQNTPDLAESLARRLAENLHVKTVVGKPVVAGAVTLIPILTVDVSFGALDVPMPAPKPDAPKPEAGAFLVSGEVRPLGFVVVSKKGTKFLAVPRGQK